MTVRQIVSEPPSSREQKRRIVIRTRHRSPGYRQLWPELHRALDTETRTVRERILGRSRMIEAPFDRVFILSGETVDGLDTIRQQAATEWDDLLPQGELKIEAVRRPGASTLSYFGHGVWVKSGNETQPGCFKIRWGGGGPEVDIVLEGTKRPAAWAENQTGLAFSFIPEATPARPDPDIVPGMGDFPPAIFFFGKFTAHEEPRFEAVAVNGEGDILTDAPPPAYSVQPSDWWKWEDKWHTVLYGGRTVFTFLLATGAGARFVETPPKNSDCLAIHGLLLPAPGYGGVLRAWADWQADGALTHSPLVPRRTALVCDGPTLEGVRVFDRARRLWSGMRNDRCFAVGEPNRLVRVRPREFQGEEGHLESKGREPAFLVHRDAGEPLGYIPLPNAMAGGTRTLRSGGGPTFQEWAVTAGQGSGEAISLAWLNTVASVVVEEGFSRRVLGLATYWMEEREQALRLRKNEDGRVEVYASKPGGKGSGTETVRHQPGEHFVLGPLHVSLVENASSPYASQGYKPLR